MKQGKSSGPDEIPTEMLSALEGLRNDLLWNLIDKIYEMEIFPNDILVPFHHPAKYPWNPRLFKPANN